MRLALSLRALLLLLLLLLALQLLLTKRLRKRRCCRGQCCCRCSWRSTGTVSSLRTLGRALLRLLRTRAQRIPQTMR